MKLRNVWVPILLGLFLANCSIDVSVEDMTPNDFLKSTILASSRGVSDGSTDATVVVMLKNSDDSLVTNFKPDFTFIDNSGSSYSGNGIVFSDCSVSNDQGISTCIIRSITVGARRLRFVNIVIELIGQVYFDPPNRNGTFTQILSSGQIDTNAGGFAVTSQVGAPFAGLKQEKNGYIIFTNTTGSITPIE